MFGIDDALIGAGVSAAGSMLSSWMTNRNNKNMAASAMQTRVNDMKAAGINPILGRVRQGGVNSDPAFRSGNMSVKR